MPSTVGETSVMGNVLLDCTTVAPVALMDTRDTRRLTLVTSDHAVTDSWSQLVHNDTDAPDTHGPPGCVRFCTSTSRTTASPFAAGDGPKFSPDTTSLRAVDAFHDDGNSDCMVATSSGADTADTTTYAMEGGL